MRLVKTIGDAAMLVAPEPGPVVATVVGLVDRSNDDGPLLRGGVASGDGPTAGGRLVRAPGEPRRAADRLRQAGQRRDLEGGPRRRRRRLRLVRRRQPPLQGREGERRGVSGSDGCRIALAEAGGLAQRVGLVRLLPGEVVVLAAEVAVGRGLLVDRPVQVEVLAERARTQVEGAPPPAARSARARCARCRTSPPSPTPGAPRRSRRPPAPRSCRPGRPRPRSWPRSAPRRRPSGPPSTGPCPRRRRRRGGPCRRRCRR